MTDSVDGGVDAPDRATLSTARPPAISARSRTRSSTRSGRAARPPLGAAGALAPCSSSAAARGRLDDRGDYRDTRSQGLFNFIAVAGSVILGLPALLLTLCGMQGEGLPVKARVNHRVVSRAVVIATGVTSEGRREVLGVDVGDSEDETFWKTFLTGLKRRGLAGVQLVISDAHECLKKAIAKSMSGASWQRCRVHFARNLLAHVAKADGEVVTAWGHLPLAGDYRTVFAQPTAAGVAAQWDSVAATFAFTHPKVAAVMDGAREDVLAFTGFPAAHWKKIWSTNPLERLNKEVKRRTDVVGVFPNDAALLRLAACLLIEAHDEWAAGERRYLSEASMAALIGTNVTELPAASDAVTDGGISIDTGVAMTA